VVCLEFVLRAELRLARHGEAAVGLVVEHGTTRYKNHITYWVRYEFTSPISRRAQGRHNVPGFIWNLVPPGTPVTILFDPNDPRRHRPLYAFQHVRLLDPGRLPEQPARPGSPLEGADAASTGRAHADGIQTDRGPTGWDGSIRTGRG
jgi:hypothetical protein